MKIGYSVEGSTDRALIKGLSKRWCPYATTVEGKFRGQTRTSRQREIPTICLALNNAGVDLIVFLTDSNDNDDNAWRTILKQEEAKLPIEYAHLAVFGVCQRNVECWLCADADWISTKTGRASTDFRVDDPKGVFESALRIGRDNKCEELIEGLIQEAPLRNWLDSASFEDFYDKLWQKSKSFDGCDMENLRDAR